MTVKVLKIKVLLFIILISTSTSFSQDTISHVVKKGETLYSISKLYDVEISELKKQNNLLTNELSINQKIIFVKSNNAYNNVIEEEEKKTKKEEGFAASIDESTESDKYLSIGYKRINEDYNHRPLNSEFHLIDSDKAFMFLVDI